MGTEHTGKVEHVKEIKLLFQNEKRLSILTGVKFFWNLVFMLIVMENSNEWCRLLQRNQKQDTG
jgi:hypothetical protein